MKFVLTTYALTATIGAMVGSDGEDVAACLSQAVTNNTKVAPSRNINDTVAARNIDVGRAATDGSVPICDVAGFATAVRDHIVYIAGELQEKGSDRCFASKGSCLQTDCYENSAIYICNDHSDLGTNCKKVATYAQDILDNCGKMIGDQPEVRAMGQKFNDDGWNVIVAESPECKHASWWH